MELLFISIIFVVPVIFLKIWPPAYKKRFFLFTIVLLLFSIYFYSSHYSLYRLGFRKDNLGASLLPNIALAVAGSLFLYLFKKKRGTNGTGSIPKFHFIAGFIFVSFIQELVYRSFLLIRLSEILGSLPTAVIINSFLFGLLHIMYPNPKRNFLLTFLGGIAFCLIYYFYPNIYSITLSHAVLNFVALKYGIIGP